MEDMPNAPMYWRGVGNQLRSHQQDFEVCVVCLAGKEGYRWNAWLAYGDLPGDWRVTGIVTYGCVKWGHRITLNQDTGVYEYERYIEGQRKVGRSSIEVTVNGVPGGGPSSSWETGVFERHGP